MGGDGNVRYVKRDIYPSQVLLGSKPMLEEIQEILQVGDC